MSKVCLPEQFKIVEGISNLTDGEARTADYVSLKNCRRCTAIVTVLGGAATAVTLTPYQATSVAAGSEKTFTNTLSWWLNDDTSASDTLVEQTAATSMATAASAANHMIVIQIDPIQLDVAGGFNCVTIKTSGASASNLVSVIWLLETVYAQATPPAAITD